MQTKQRTNSCGRNAVLTSAGFCNDALFVHATRQQYLAQGVVDFVCAGVKQVFSLEIDLRTAGVFS